MSDDIETHVRESNIDPAFGGPYHWYRNSQNQLELFHLRDLLLLARSEGLS